MNAMRVAPANTSSQEAGTAVPSFAADLLAELVNFELLATMLGDLYGAGSDTVSGVARETAHY